MDRDELILQKLSALAEDVRDLRKNVAHIQSDVTDIRLQQADDRRQWETANVKLAAELQRVEAKVDSGLERVEAKLTAELQRVEAKVDGVVTNIGERKEDTNERWKVGGIIVSSAIAILAFIKSFFFS